MDYFNPQPKKYSQPKMPKTLKKVADKNKGENGLKKPTGELALFKEIYKKLGGKCQLTGNKIEFHPNCFMHILSKGAYPRFRLYDRNVFMVEQDAHFLYDNSDKQTLLEQYPNAEIIYEKKEELKIEYYKPKPTV